jgi:hypothetical protein
MTLHCPSQFRGHDERAPPPLEGSACRVYLSEGRACHVRGAKLDYPCRCGGRDRRAPPILSPQLHPSIGLLAVPENLPHTYGVRVFLLQVFG